MDKVIVIGHGKPWDMDGRKGVKISYISDSPIDYDGILGFVPMQDNFDPFVLSDLQVIPGLYEIKTAMIPGKNNTAKTIITGFKFVKEVKIG